MSSVSPVGIFQANVADRALISSRASLSTPCSTMRLLCPLPAPFFRLLVRPEIVAVHVGESNQRPRWCRSVCNSAGDVLNHRIAARDHCSVGGPQRMEVGLDGLGADIEIGNGLPSISRKSSLALCRFSPAAQGQSQGHDEVESQEFHFMLENSVNMSPIPACPAFPDESPR